MTDSPKMADASKRRSLQAIAGLLGLGLSAATLDALADYVPPTGQADGGQFFTKSQLLCAAALAEVVIPATDTPGALAVGAHNYLDYHLKVGVSAGEQASITGLLDKLDLQAKAVMGKLFSALEPGQQSALVEQLSQSQAPFSGDDTGAWRYFISLVVFAYYTSEAGATKELSYLPIPGGYTGEVPFSEVGRAWSLQPFV